MSSRSSIQSSPSSRCSSSTPACVCGRIGDSGPEPYEHRDAIALGVGRENLAEDSGHDLPPNPVPSIGGPAAVSARRPFPPRCGASRSCSDADGRSTSVGHATNESTVERMCSSSCRHSVHLGRCAFKAAASRRWKRSSAYSETSSVRGHIVLSAPALTPSLHRSIAPAAWKAQNGSAFSRYRAAD